MLVVLIISQSAEIKDYQNLVGAVGQLLPLQFYQTESIF